MEFTTQHFIALAPMLITTITTVVVMLAIAWKRNHSQTFLLSTVGLNLALLSILPLAALFLTLQRYWQVDLAAGAVKA